MEVVIESLVIFQLLSLLTVSDIAITFIGYVGSSTCGDGVVEGSEE